MSVTMKQLNQLANEPTDFRKAALILSDAPNSAILDQAEALLKCSAALSAADEGVLFRALHHCGAASCYDGESRSTERVESLRRKIIDYLVKRNIPLVYEMCRRCGVAGVDPDEMLSEGFWTLYRAVKGFDVERGLRFSTYACRSILYSFLSLAKKRRREREVLEKLLKERQAFMPVHDEQEVIDGPMFLDRVNEALTDKALGFTAIECFVLERRFLSASLEGPRTLDSIGRVFQLSKERIRQIQSGALCKLRTILTDRSVHCNARVLAYCNAGTADRRSV